MYYCLYFPPGMTYRVIFVQVFHFNGLLDKLFLNLLLFTMLMGYCIPSQGAQLILCPIRDVTVKQCHISSSCVSHSLWDQCIFLSMFSGSECSCLLLCLRLCTPFLLQMPFGVLSLMW